MHTYTHTIQGTSYQTVKHTSSGADIESVRRRRAHVQEKEDSTSVSDATSKHYAHYMHTNWRSLVNSLPLFTASQH